METERYFKKYGDRTSSLISLYPHFNSFISHDGRGEIRYSEKSNVVGIANEPLTEESEKINIISEFFEQKKFNKKSKLIFPISQQLGSDLSEVGYYVWQIGVEPIFTLSEYFGSLIDPLQNNPIARNLSRRGAKVVEVLEEEILKFQDEIIELKEESLSQKKMAPLEFLNVISPLSHKQYKRYFVLKDRNNMTAVLTASPIFSNDKITGYFFNDILKKNSARSSSIELLIIESMRILHLEGTLEVRLGMCPLAEINPQSRNSKELNNIFKKWSIGYNFKNLYNFKTKLSPSRMDPLYLASDRPELYRMLINVLKLHVTKSFLADFVKRNWYGYKKKLKLKENIQTVLIKNKSLSIIARTKWTLSLFAFFVSLHFVRTFSEFGKSIYTDSAYIPGNVSLSGLFLGPMFHNHTLHLVGDQLSFLVFAGILEYAFGISFMLITMAIGLWLSNPVTHALLATTLKYTSDYWWQKVLLEKDYGTSNGVFALVGASLYVLKDNTWLFIPFLFHALFVCLQRESFLATHHLVGMLLGYIFSLLYFTKKKSSHYI